MEKQLNFSISPLTTCWNSTEFKWQCQNPLSRIRNVLKKMGQSLWINSLDKPQTFSKCCKNKNCQRTFCVECHFDLLPFHGRKLNLMLLFSSWVSTHSVAPLFSPWKESLHFTALSCANSHWTNMKFCTPSGQILFFNPVFEISLNSQ